MGQDKAESCDHRGDVKGAVDRNYALGYLVAHEFLHQIYGKASFKNKGISPSNSHSSGLNTPGRWALKSVLGMKPSKTLRPLETIPSEKLQLIKEYLKNL